MQRKDLSCTASPQESALCRVSHHVWTEGRDTWRPSRSGLDLLVVLLFLSLCAHLIPLYFLSDRLPLIIRWQPVRSPEAIAAEAAAQAAAAREAAAAQEAAVARDVAAAQELLPAQPE